MKESRGIITKLVAIAAVFLIIGIVLLFSTKKEDYLEVSFDTDGGGYLEAIKVKKGEKIGEIEKPTRDGYSFLYWMINGVPVEDSYEITGNVKLVAAWEDNNPEIPEYTIIFDSDGGSIIPNQTVKENGKIVKPSNPTKDGYVFKSWTLNEEDYDFDKKVTENMTLKASWEEVKKEETNPTTNGDTNNNTNQNPTTNEEKKYTVTFNSNGGSAVSAQTIEKGKNAKKPSDPTKNGYRFDDWLLDGKVYNFSWAVTSNITLVARWIEVPKNNYTVTFDSTGGSVVSSQTVVEGSKVTKPTNPTKVGYNFSSWLLNGKAYSFDSPVTSNLTLVASWVQKNYTVSVVKADPYSPDSILSVWEEGVAITVQSIKYSDGTYLCSGSNTTVNTGDIAGVTSFIVVLSNGTQVTATLG